MLMGFKKKKKSYYHYYQLDIYITINMHTRDFSCLFKFPTDLFYFASFIGTWHHVYCAKILSCPSFLSILFKGARLVF